MVNERELIQQIKTAKKCSEVYQLVGALQFGAPSGRLSSEVAKKLETLDEESDVKVALLSNFTVDFFPPHLITSLAAVGAKAVCHIAPFGQYYQAVLDDQSDLVSFDPDIAVLLLNLKELSHPLYYRFAELTPEQRKDQERQILEHVNQWVDAASANLSAMILVGNFVLPPSAQLGFADAREPQSETEFFQSLNSKLRMSLIGNDRAYLLDLNSLVLQQGWERVFDPRMYYLAKLLCNEGFAGRVARDIARFFVAANGLAKKCLVLDLDNTLWGGVLGEEGVSGVKVGNGDPVSEAFTDFQYKVKALKQRGIILAACSKNNFEDVAELFSNRTDMPLKLDDFAAIRINWERKDNNLREIAAELNIGTDSMVFIDDNPAEVDLIRQMVPEVTALELPSSPEAMCAFLDHLPLFEKLHVLESDRTKTAQYLENRQRADLERQAAGIEDYLKGLDTKVDMRLADDGDLQRVHQLFTKTNQFNVTTIRYTPGEIKEKLDSELSDMWSFTVEDRFGKLGLVGLLLIEREGDKAIVDSFIMSCRAMGRGIETAVLNWIDDYYLGRLGFSLLEATYVPTKKNKPVENLFPSHGFQIVNESPQATVFRKSAGQSKPSRCDWIELTVSQAPS